MPLSDAFHERAREIVSRYPQSRSAVLMLLHAAQDEIGYVSGEAIREVAKVLGLSSADVAGVATFHTMFKQRSPGRFLVSVCTNVSCDVRGAGEVAKALADEIGPPHTPTEDGLLSWEPVECLAFCDGAPIVQVNYRDLPEITPDGARKLVGDLRAGRDLGEVLDALTPSDGGTGA